MAVPMEPSKTLAAAMKASDVIIITTNLEWANRFAHVDPVAESVALGAKIGSIEEGMADWDLTYDDIDLIVGRAEKLIAAMEGAEWCHVTTPAGTDVMVCIKDRPALKVVPIKGAGEMMGPVPLWGEVAYAAVEDKTEGVIIVDGIMLGVGEPRSLKEPMRWEIHDGRCTDISGGVAADMLREVVAGSDENANVIAEYAIGTSHKSPTGSPSEKGLMGTVHFALGDNSHCYPGGCSHSTAAPRRLDLRDVTIEVDGRARDEGRCSCHLRPRRACAWSPPGGGQADGPARRSLGLRADLRAAERRRRTRCSASPPGQPGAATKQLVHEVDELCYIVEGEGKLSIGDETVSYRAGQAVLIPAGVPHGVVNDSPAPMSMVYVFSHPQYPPTRPA